MINQMNVGQALLYLTSESEEEIELVLDILKEDHSLYELVKPFVLHYIKGYLKDPYATLMDIVHVTFPQDLRSFSTKTNKERIELRSLSLRSVECIVNFYGGLAARFFNFNSYQDSIQKVHTKKTLIQINKKYFQRIKNGFEEMVEFLREFEELKNHWYLDLMSHFNSFIYSIELGNGHYTALFNTMYYNEFFAFAMTYAFGPFTISADLNGAIKLPQIIWGFENGIKLEKKQYGSFEFDMPKSPLQIYNHCVLDIKNSNTIVSSHIKVEKDWQDYLAYRKKGTNAYKEGQYQEALQLFEKAASKKATKTIYLFILHIHQELQLEEKEILLKINDIDPEDVIIINNLAYTYLENNELDLAFKTIQRALQIQPLFDLGLATRAEISFAMGNEEDMFTCLDAAALVGFDISECNLELYNQYGHTERYQGILRIVEEYKKINKRKN